MRETAAPITLRFLCLARNCAPTLPAFLTYLHELAAAGIPNAALIGENGSTDDTRAILERAISPSLQLLDTTFMQAIPGRLTRMAAGRQALLEAARDLHGPEPFVCVADLDNVMTAPPPPQAVIVALAQLQASPNLFAVGATSTPFFYDVLSLQAPGHDYRSLNAEIAAAKRKPLIYFHFHKTRIYANQRRATQPTPLQCTSSFNGFCLYNAPAYYAGTYRAPDEAHVCEHISLNHSIHHRTGQHMLVLPKLQVQTPPDHGPVNILKFWSDRLRKML